MKAGIVTFYNHSNYGAVLQSYALQTALGKLGAEAFHIDFGDIDPQYPAMSNPVIGRIISNQKKRDQHFRQFREQYLNVKNINDCIGSDEIEYFVGSDQVWNPEITNCDARYFLDFTVRKHRHAYACSLGSIAGSVWENTYSDAIKEFADVSVREGSGAEQIENMTGIKSEVVLDPTLLIDADDWKQFIVTENPYDRPYLLYIMVQNDVQRYNYWQKSAHGNHMDFKSVTASYFPQAGFDPWSNVSVQDWVNLVYHSRQVVTSSFHGLAFSIIFHKDYIVEGLHSGLEKRNSRIYELLKLLDLDPHGKADAASDAIIDIKKKESLDFLKHSLGS